MNLSSVRVEPEPGGTYRVVTNTRGVGFVVGGRLAKQLGSYPEGRVIGLSLEDANAMCKKWQVFLDAQERAKGLPVSKRKAIQPILR